MFPPHQWPPGCAIGLSPVFTTQLWWTKTGPADFFGAVWLSLLSNTACWLPSSPGFPRGRVILSGKKKPENSDVFQSTNKDNMFEKGKGKGPQLTWKDMTPLQWMVRPSSYLTQSTSKGSTNIFKLPFVLLKLTLQDESVNKSNSNLQTFKNLLTRAVLSDLGLFFFFFKGSLYNADFHRNHLAAELTLNDYAGLSGDTHCKLCSACIKSK